MGFVAGFYTFQLELSCSDRGVFESLRLKIPRHPDESDSYFAARVLAFCHCYRVGQEFSQGLFKPRQPAVWKKNLLDNTVLWAEVGCPELKKIKRALQNDHDTEYRVYLYEPGQVYQFCQYLRGSKSNWIGPVDFFEFGASLKEIGAQVKLKNTWQVTIVDHTLYLATEEHQFVLEIEPVMMWQEFQTSLQRTSSVG